MVNPISISSASTLTGLDKVGQPDVVKPNTIQFSRKDVGSSTTQLLFGQISQNRTTSIGGKDLVVGFSTALTPTAVAQDLLAQLKT